MTLTLGQGHSQSKLTGPWIKSNNSIKFHNNLISNSLSNFVDRKSARHRWKHNLFGGGETQWRYVNKANTIKTKAKAKAMASKPRPRSRPHTSRPRPKPRPWHQGQSQNRTNNAYNAYIILTSMQLFLPSLHCALSLAAQCIVIGPVCLCVGLCVCLFVCLWVCYHDISKLRASIFTKLGL